MVASAASVKQPQGTTPLRLGRVRDQVSPPSSQEESGLEQTPPLGSKPCKADKGDTVSLSQLVLFLMYCKGLR